MCVIGGLHFRINQKKKGKHYSSADDRPGTLSNDGQPGSRSKQKKEYKFLAWTVVPIMLTMGTEINSGMVER